jgi:hypothetical protein
VRVAPVITSHNGVVALPFGIGYPRFGSLSALLFVVVKRNPFVYFPVEVSALDAFTDTVTYDQILKASVVVLCFLQSG